MNKITLVLLIQLLFLNQVNCQERPETNNPAEVKKPDRFTINELALPSEVRDLPKKMGSIYYSPSIKDKVLVPINFWGEIKDSGLHFIPVDTSLVSGISLAGGMNSSADLNGIQISSFENVQLQKFKFALTQGMTDEAAKFTLKPGDVVFVEKSNFFENRSYYTSLVGIIATMLSTYVLYKQIQDKKI